MSAAQRIGRTRIKAWWDPPRWIAASNGLNPLPIRCSGDSSRRSCNAASHLPAVDARPQRQHERPDGHRGGAARVPVVAS